MDTYLDDENPAFGSEEVLRQETDNGCIPGEASSDDAISAGQSHADARDSLGSRASVSETDADVAMSDAPTDYSTMDVPGADLSDEVHPFDMPSTPEQVEAARAFFHEQRSNESSGQRERARKVSRVFSVMQYREHPETGEPIYTQDQLKAGLQSLDDSYEILFAYVAHPYDRIVEVDEGSVECRCVGLKPPHWHLVILVKGQSRPTTRTVSDALEVPSARVRTPRDIVAEEDLHKGAGAAEKAFFDFAEYLPHESRGKNAIAGINQPSRTYLVDNRQEGKPGKYQYGRGRVVANFDFSAELDRHMAGRVSAAEGGRALTKRKQKLRRLVAEGMTLEEAESADFDAFADDLPRLERLRQRWEGKPENQVDPTDGLGKTWRKTLMLMVGRSGVGKGILADEVATQIQEIVALAGLSWDYVEPPGRNSLEAVVGAEIVHHDDLRFDAVPAYDEALRWFDPNRATEAYKRHSRLEQVAVPRLILVSTSETSCSLGISFKARKDTDQLALNARTSTYLPVDIDEFLRRIGWLVEVSLPDGVSPDSPVDVLRAEMVVSIHRVRMPDAEPRIERAYDRHDRFIGEIATRHRKEPVAVLKGAVPAARFLAITALLERNTDVVEQIPTEHFEQYLTEKADVEQASEDARNRQRAEAEAAERAEAEAAQEAELAWVNAETERALEHQRLQSICTCDRYPLHAQSHADKCPALPEEERQRRADARNEAMAKKAEKIRANGLILVKGGAA